MPHHSVNPLAVYAQSFCLGAYLYSIKEKKVRKEFADRVILAAGGIGQIYRYTTNPPVATGDGIALAWRAGCRIVNMEYTQFHPTTLAIKGAHNFLISEALRGEGGVLVNHEGKDFTRSYDPRGSLASRDRVSRAIMSELEKSGREYVYLDLSKLKPAEIRHRFPNIYRRCLEYKIDITSEPIPVRPAFHFSCGGVLTDLAGRTTLPNLYAVGETACTGVHGANRLASTSLLEGMVFGKKVAEDLERSDFRFEKYSKEIRSWEDEAVLLRHDPVLLRQDWETLQSTMWNYVGIIRMPGRMNRAGETLRDLKNQVDHFYWNVRLSREMVELRNAIQTALIITNSALKNKKSSGCHFITDDHD
jgi:L-aspartate oxidase